MVNNFQDIQNLSKEKILGRIKEIEDENKETSELWGNGIREMIEAYRKQISVNDDEMCWLALAINTQRLQAVQALLDKVGLYWDSIYNSLLPQQEDTGIFYIRSPHDKRYYQEYTSPLGVKALGLRSARRSGWCPHVKICPKLRVNFPKNATPDTVVDWAAKNIPQALETRLHLVPAATVAKTPCDVVERLGHNSVSLSHRSSASLKEGNEIIEFIPAPKRAKP